MQRFGGTNQSGVTIVELLIVMSVSVSLMTLVTAFALNFWGNTVTLSGDQATVVSRLNVSTYLNKMISQGNGFVTQNDIADNNAGAPDPAIAAGTYWVPIHAKPGTTTMGAAGTIKALLYLRKPSINTSKNIVLNGAIPYEDNLIIYMDGTTKQLRVRTLANTGAAANASRTSCPTNKVTSSCPADAVISDDVSSVGLRYFSRSGNAVDYTSITDPVTATYIGPDFPAVEIVELTVKYYRKAQLHNALDTTNQTIVRVALRN
ncbi:MAG: hypothetical protein QFB87_01415 [Patescibacteria group bacterium]|nr:hypothetical protein [Patescibacteria group bacterium]